MGRGVWGEVKTLGEGEIEAKLRFCDSGKRRWGKWRVEKVKEISK